MQCLTACDLIHSSHLFDQLNSTQPSTAEQPKKRSQVLLVFH